MNIAAFDLSLSGTGYAFSGTGSNLYLNVLTPAKQLAGMARLDWIRARVLEIADRAELVIFEDLVPSNTTGHTDIVGLAYLIRRELWYNSIPYLLVFPTQLKKFACGSAGSAKNPVKKEHVLKAVFQRWGLDVNDNNVADAIVLNFIARALVGEWECQIDAQRDVLAKLRISNASALKELGVAT